MSAADKRAVGPGHADHGNLEWRWESVAFGGTVPAHLSLGAWKEWYYKFESRAPAYTPRECKDGIAHVPIFSQAFPDGFFLSEHVTVADAKESFPALTQDPCFILPSSVAVPPTPGANAPSFDDQKATLRLSGYASQVHAEVPFTSFTVAPLQTVGQGSTTADKILHLWAGCYINASRSFWILKRGIFPPFPPVAKVASLLSQNMYRNTAYAKKTSPKNMQTISAPAGTVMPYVSVAFPDQPPHGQAALPSADWWTTSLTTADPIKLRCNWFGGDERLGGYPSVPDGGLQRALLVHQICMEVAVANAEIADKTSDKFDMVCTDYRTGAVFALCSTTPWARSLAYRVWAEPTPAESRRGFVCAPCMIALGSTLLDRFAVEPYHSLPVLQAIGTMFSDKSRWKLDASGQAAEVPVTDWSLSTATPIASIGYDKDDSTLIVNSATRIQANLDAPVPCVQVGGSCLTAMIPCVTHALASAPMRLQCNMVDGASQHVTTASRPRVSVVRCSAQGIVLRIIDSDGQSAFPPVVVGTRQGGDGLSELLAPVGGCGAIYYHGGDVNEAVRMAYAQPPVNVLSALSHDAGGVITALALVFVIMATIGLTAWRPRTGA